MNHCLGHPSLSKLKKMVFGLPHLESLQCESFQLGKHVRVFFSSFILMCGALVRFFYPRV